MTRKRQNLRVRLIVAALIALIGLAAYAVIVGYDDLYNFIKDTAILVATVAAAYLAGVYQRRLTFLRSLREQWREIVQSKSALLFYLHQETPTLDDFLVAQRQLSETIDNMRIVYRNVGETDELIGYFPYEPLHDMRRVMDTVDPRKGEVSGSAKYNARGEIWDSFNAIREHFLDEFDIEEPTWPIITPHMKRTMRSGAAAYAEAILKKQSKTL